MFTGFRSVCTALTLATATLAALVGSPALADSPATVSNPATPAASSPAVPLNSFESKADLSWVRGQSAKLTLVQEHATDGLGALRVDFQPAAWPNVYFGPKKPLDWRAAGKLAVDVTNPGTEALPFWIRVDDSTAADGTNHCRTGAGLVGPGETATYVMSFGADRYADSMRGLPSEAGSREMGAGGAGAFDKGHIVAFQLFMASPTTTKTLVIDNVRLLPSTTMAGIVDPFGQYAKAEWPGKLHSADEFAVRRTAEAADIKAHPAPADRDRFGGWAKGPKLKATGFFRTEKYDGKWSLVDPDGHLFFSLGLDNISLNSDETMTEGREPLFTWLPEPGAALSGHAGYVTGVFSGPLKEGATFDFRGANLERKYGANYDAANSANVLARLPSWGINTIANWSDTGFYRNGKVPYVATGGIGGDHARIASATGYWGDMHDPFDPAFADDVRASLEPLAAQVAGDPWCLGYFVDNELSWGAEGTDAGHYDLALGALGASATDSPAKQAFVAQLKARYGGIGALNTAWKASFATWAALESAYKPAGSFSAAMQSDLSAFTLSLSRQYFKVIRDELHAIDPKHLYLGCRFASRVPEAVQAAAELCDVVSFNIYAPQVDPGAWQFAATLNKPCIIGEFHFGALDRGMFHTGLVATPSQAARAAMYTDYVHSVLDNPAFVGCHWFQYADEPLTGRAYDGENYNIGFIDVTDTPYPELLAAARKVHAEAYTRRYGAK